MITIPGLRIMYLRLFQLETGVFAVADPGEGRALTFSSRVLNTLFMGKSIRKRCGSKDTGWVFGNCGNRLPASAMFFLLSLSALRCYQENNKNL